MTLTYFTLKKSLYGKGEIITFIDKKGFEFTYSHDKVYDEVLSDLEKKTYWQNYEELMDTTTFPKWILKKMLT